MSADFYRAFEDRYRGSREAIRARQSVYLPFLHALRKLAPDAMVTDLGCGRGEWLELLRSEGIPAQGVDMDEGMLQACRELGLDVRHGDAISFLQGLGPASQAAVTGFHLAEHLPFDVLQQLVTQALRVLRPGGLLILETPNPENVLVGTSGFYVDPTHVRPLPPLLLNFLLEFHGFARVKTLRLNESEALRGHGPVALSDVLLGVSPDHAVVAQKAPDPGTGDTSALAALDAAFSKDHGVTLLELAQRHEQQWEARLRQAQAMAELARNAALAGRGQGGGSQVLERLTALEHKLFTETMETQRQLRSVYQSRSWRLTRPLRWLTEQRLALREQGARERIRRLSGKAAAVGARPLLRVFQRYPGLHQFADRAMGAVGLRNVASLLRTQMETAGSRDEESLTAPARRIHDALRQACASHADASVRKN
jgi:SAM-dependent methyltransferase